MTVSPVDGRLYISVSMSYQIIRVKTMGPVRNLKVNFEVVAGNGDQCTPGEADKCGDGGRALEARLMNPKGKPPSGVIRSVKCRCSLLLLDLQSTCKISPQVNCIRGNLTSVLTLDV